MPEEADVQIQPLLDDDEINDMGAFAFEPVPRKRRTPIWLIVLIVLLVLALVGGSLTYWLLHRTKPVQYSQGTATVGNISTTIAATGPLSANAVYNMNFPVSGTVSEIDVQVGQQVKQGQVLAKITIDKTQMQDTINQDQLAVTGAQQALNAQQTALSNAQTSLSNTQAQNAATLKVDFDTEQTDLANCSTQATATVKPVSTITTAPTATAEAQSAAPTLTQCKQSAVDKYAQAQAQLAASNTTTQNAVTSAQNAVTSAQNNLDKANETLQTAQDSLNTANGQAALTSPTDATVAALTGVVGQTTSGSGSSTSGSSSSSTSTGTGASSGSTSASGFITLVDTAKYTITAQVNEADIGNVQVNQPAKFTLSAFPALTFRASVSNIGIIGTTSSNVVTYPVLLTVDMSSLANAHVYPGMTATVNITTAQRIGALLIPATALTFLNTALQAGEVSRTDLTNLTAGNASTGNTTGGTGSTGSSRIVLTLKNGKLVPILITTGLTSGQFVEVISGLKENDQVVVGQTGGPTSTTTTRTGGAGGFGGGGAGGFGGGGAGGFGGGGGGAGGGAGGGGARGGGGG